MSISDFILEVPSYGWADENGKFIKPTFNQLFSEFLRKINVFKDIRNYLPFLGWFWILCLSPFFLLFFFKYFTFGLLITGFIYGMVIMGSHGTFWYHRYSTHRAFTFKNDFWKFIGQHLVVKVVPEEVYVLSHHIHHEKSDTPGDPYNAFGGFFYCFFADTNHQSINKNLTEEQYAQAIKLMDHTGCKINSYEDYKKYGSVVSPSYILLSWVLNWTFWGAVFYFLGEVLHVSGGGMGLLTACFAGTFVWAVGIRTFNYEGHAKGKGAKGWGKTDFNRKDYSINQLWPGFVAGEWHNNHHLYPTGARSGFLGHQIDIPWYIVNIFNWVGGISEYKDYKKQFLENYYLPFKETGKYRNELAPEDYSGKE